METCACGEDHYVIDDLHNKAHPGTAGRQCPHATGSLASRSIYLNTKNMDHGFSGSGDQNGTKSDQTGDSMAEDDGDIEIALDALKRGQYSKGVNHLLQHSDVAREQIIQMMGDMIQGEVNVALDTTPLLRKNLKILKLEEYQWDEVLEVYEQVCPLFSVCMRAALMGNPDQIPLGDEGFQAVMGVLMSVIFFVLRPDKDNNVLRYVKSLTKWLSTWKDTVDESRKKVQVDESKTKALFDESRKKEIERKRLAEQKAKNKAHLETEEAKVRKAELEAKQLADKEKAAKEQAEREAAHKKKSEFEKLKLQAEAQRKAKLEAQHIAQLEAQRKSQLEAVRKSQIEAQQRAQLEAQRKAQLEAQRKARVDAQRKVHLEAQRKAQLEAQKKAQLEVQRKAQLEAQRKAQLEAQRKAQLEAQREAQREAQQKAELEAQRQAELEAEQQAQIETQPKTQGESIVLHVVPDNSESTVQYTLPDPSPFSSIGETFRGDDGKLYIQATVETANGTEHVLLLVPDEEDSTAESNVTTSINTMDIQEAEALTTGADNIQYVIQDESNATEGAVNEQYITLAAPESEDPIETLPVDVPVEGGDSETLTLEQVLHRIVNLDGTCPEPSSSEGHTLEEVSAVDLGTKYENLKYLGDDENESETHSVSSYAETIAAHDEGDCKTRQCIRQTVNLDQVSVSLDDADIPDKSDDGMTVDIEVPEGLSIGEPFKITDEPNKGIWATEYLPMSTHFGPYCIPFAKRKRFNDLPIAHWASFMQQTCLRYKPNVKAVRTPQGLFYVTKVPIKPGTELNTWRHLYINYRGKKPEKCTLCEFTPIASRRKSGTYQEKSWNRCHECDKVFLKLNSYKRHMKFIHRTEKQFACHFCDKKYYSKSQQVIHERQHTGDRPFSCDECGASFASSGRLHRHEGIHRNERPYSCLICEKTFRTTNDVDRHLKIHTKEPKHECPDCGDMFLSLVEKYNHMHMMHIDTKDIDLNLTSSSTTEDIKTRISEQQEAEDIKPFLCHECGKAFISKSKLSSHKIVHKSRNTFVCEHCGKGFYKGADLKRHLRTHTGEKPFKCPECGSAFTSNYVLQAHILKHRGVTPFSCKFCKKGFTKKWSMKVHMTVHTRDRSKITKSHTAWTAGMSRKPHLQTNRVKEPAPLHRCDTCGRVFASLQGLNRHAEVHMQDKPYTCELCGQSFKGPTVLSVHMLEHSNEAPHKCQICDKGFTKPGFLRAHMRKVHHIDSY